METFDRRSGIGASDAAKVVGVSKFGTPHDVWLEKMGLSAPLVESEAMEWGKILEPAVLAKYSRATSRPIIVLHEPDGSQRTLWHPQYPWMYAHLDAMTKRKPFRIVEAKTTNPFANDEWGEPGSDQVPADYHIQVQHQMAVTGWDVADIPVLIGGQKFRIYTVERDPELIDMLIEAEAHLWESVQRGEPPEVDGSEGAARLIAARYATDDGTELEATDEQTELVHRYLTAQGVLKEADASVTLLKHQIQEQMGAASALSGQGFRATWKATAGSVSWKSVAESLAPDDPAVWNKVLDANRGAGSRRFLVSQKEIA